MLAIVLFLKRFHREIFVHRECRGAKSAHSLDPAKSHQAADFVARSHFPADPDGTSADAHREIQALERRILPNQKFHVFGDLRVVTRNSAGHLKIVFDPRDSPNCGNEVTDQFLVAGRGHAASQKNPAICDVEFHIRGIHHALGPERLPNAFVHGCG